MFKINILHVGTLKDDYFKAAADEYIKRCGAFAKLALAPLPEAKLPPEPNPAQAAAALREEGAAILRRLAQRPPRSLTVALCVEGEQPDSLTFARMLREAADGGAPEADFVIGGPLGLSDEVKAACGRRISISRLTLPHRLAQVVLLEQIYRALSINAGRGYHR